MLLLSWNWASSCLLFPETLTIYFQTYSWQRRSSSAQWWLTQTLRRPGPPVLLCNKFGSTWTPAEHSVGLQVMGKDIVPGPVEAKMQASWARTGNRDQSSSVMKIPSERESILVSGYSAVCSPVWNLNKRGIKPQKGFCILMSEPESSVLRVSALTTTFSEVHMLSDFSQSLKSFPP